MPKDEALVSVEQVDRVAAAAWLDKQISSEHYRAASLVLWKEWDEHPLVQAFARHRQAAIEEAARLTDAHATNACEIARCQGQNHIVASGRNPQAGKLPPPFVIAPRDGACEEP